MPLIKSGSDAALKTNISTLMGEVGKSKHVKSRDQALAIAYDVKRRNRAMGGLAPAPWQVRSEARSMMHTGPIISAVPGRTDRHDMNVPAGSYVVPAQAVSHLGQNNTLAGMKVLGNMFGSGGPYGAAGAAIKRGAGAPRPPRTMSDTGGARGKGTGYPVPIKSAGGEFVIEPHVVMAIGGGDIKRGHAILDSWIVKIQKDHAKTIKNLPPPAKS